MPSMSLKSTIPGAPTYVVVNILECIIHVLQRCLWIRPYHCSLRGPMELDIFLELILICLRHRCPFFLELLLIFRYECGELQLVAFCTS
jgi:hypothetical protein